MLFQSIDRHPFKCVCLSSASARSWTSTWHEPFFFRCNRQAGSLCDPVWIWSFCSAGMKIIVSETFNSLINQTISTFLISLVVRLQNFYHLFPFFRSQSLIDVNRTRRLLKIKLKMIERISSPGSPIRLHAMSCNKFIFCLQRSSSTVQHRRRYNHPQRRRLGERGWCWARENAHHRHRRHRSTVRPGPSSWCLRHNIQQTSCWTYVHRRSGTMAARTEQCLN